MGVFFIFRIRNCINITCQLFLSKIFFEICSSLIQTKVLLPQEYATVADFGHPVQAHWFYCFQRFSAHMMKVIPETRHVQ
jgi:hypothetical protein